MHEKISEHFPHLNENGEIDGVGIIRKLPPENNPNARDVFDTIYCRVSKIFSSNSIVFQLYHCKFILRMVPLK